MLSAEHFGRRRAEKDCRPITSVVPIKQLRRAVDYADAVIKQHHPSIFHAEEENKVLALDVEDRAVPPAGKLVEVGPHDRGRYPVFSRRRRQRFDRHTGRADGQLLFELPHRYGGTRCPESDVEAIDPAVLRVSRRRAVTHPGRRIVGLALSHAGKQRECEDHYGLYG